MFGFGAAGLKKIGPASYSKNALVKMGLVLSGLFVLLSVLLSNADASALRGSPWLSLLDEWEQKEHTDPTPADPQLENTGVRQEVFVGRWATLAKHQTVDPAEVLDVLFLGSISDWEPDWSLMPQAAPWLPVAKAMKATIDSKGVLKSMHEATGAPSEQTGSLVANIEPRDPLQTMADQSSRQPWVAYALGHVQQSQWDFDAAAAAYDQEYREHGHVAACHWAVLNWSWAHNAKQLKNVANDPNYAPHLPGHDRIGWAMQAGDWPKALGLVLPTWWQSFKHVDTWTGVLALVSGLCWLLFVFNFSGSGGSLQSGLNRLAWCVVAIVLGAFSTQVTLFLLNIQTELFHFDYRRANDEGIARGLLHCLLIGLREEFSKTLLLLPLVFVFRKRVDVGLWLLLSACVGLGFAIQENLGYIDDGVGLSGRFVTANFFHMTLTALIGYHLFWLVQNPKRHGNAFLEITGICVGAHALYDALLIVPEFGDGDYFAMGVFILLAYQYFHLLRGLRDRQRQWVSMTSVLVFGLVVTLGGSLVLLSAREGFVIGALLLASEVIGVALITFMYFQQIDETLLP